VDVCLQQTPLRHTNSCSVKYLLPFEKIHPLPTLNSSLVNVSASPSSSTTTTFVKVTPGSTGASASIPPAPSTTKVILFLTLSVTLYSLAIFTLLFVEILIKIYYIFLPSSFPRSYIS